VATIAYAAPRLVPTGPIADSDPSYNYYPFTGTINEADFLTLSAGVAAQATQSAIGGAGPTALAGLAIFPQTNVYHAFSGAGTGLNFGSDQTGTALVPATNQFIGAVAFYFGARLEISLNTAITLANSLVGTQVGIAYVSPFYVADTTVTNKVATIVQLPGGPDQPAGRAGISNGVLGDSGGRVIIEFNIASAIQV
jgi:hypothetical protein